VNFDLYVRGGSAPDSQTFDCSATGPYQFGFCRIVDPAPGPWFLRAERVADEGLFQLVATTFPVDPALCGNDSRDPGEACDAADAGTCATGCQSTCECLVCSSGDLDIRRVRLAPSLAVKGRLGDDLGTYTALDPVATGATILFTDGTDTVTIDVPPRDPGWTLVNAKRGRYRWRGGRGAAVKQLQFRVRPKQPMEWNVRLQGGKVPGAAALDVEQLTVRMRLGDRCAEHAASVGDVGRPR
jgi:hypothetical protein